MQLILGLNCPTRGTATVKRGADAEYPAPLAEVRSLLEARPVPIGGFARHRRVVAVGDTAAET